jgi:hypothetical protein
VWFSTSSFCYTFTIFVTQRYVKQKRCEPRSPLRVWCRAGQPACSPPSLRAEPIFSLALNLTRIVVVVFFTTFSSWRYVERLGERGQVQSSLAAASSVDGSLRHAHLCYAIRDLPQTCQTTHGWGIFRAALSDIEKQCSPHRKGKNDISNRPSEHQRTCAYTPMFRSVISTLIKELPAFVKSIYTEWHKGQVTG